MVGQKSTKAQSVFFHIFSCLLGFIMVYPLLWLLMSSFKSNDTMFHNAWSLIPEKWAAVTNYLSGFEGVAGIPFWRFFANSAIVTVVSVVGSIFCSLLAAYALSRLKFKGSGFWFGCVVMTMMIPSQVMVVPQYIILKHLGLSDTLVSMTLPWVFGHGFFIFLIAQYMRGIPRDLDEAAMLDGCSKAGILFKIMIPIVKPAIVTASIFAFYWIWQDFFQPLIFVSSPENYTIPLALNLYLDPNSYNNYGGLFASVYPELEARYSEYPDRFRALWQQGIDAQKGMRVVWNIGFRGQGDRPFWEDDPRYDTPAKRGALISSLIRQQYDLVKQSDPDAVCCTNLYGEVMDLYRQGCLDLPADVIKIWADNGYGRMVSRRQGNDNPRVPALPPEGDGGAHGVYYHASFYDLQAASHITMLPNSAGLVCDELKQALARGAEDYWLVNCSNVKPHLPLLDLIARLWQTGEAEPVGHSVAYAQSYYGSAAGWAVAKCLRNYADHALSYGPHEDDHAGDQFYNHVPRMLITQFISDRSQPAESLRWLCALPALSAQGNWCADRYAAACASYDGYLRECEATAAVLTGPARTLFQDSLLLQAQLYALWSAGALAVCQALQAGFVGDWARCFYLAGRAKRAYTAADATMRAREHGKWIDFYANECQTDVKQTAQLCGYLMSFVRTLGEGPHFYEWMRDFGDSEAERRVMLILNTENHPDDDALWRLMEQRWGE